MDTASVSKSDDRSAVMHDGDNMSTANIDMAASFNSDDILPPDTEEGGGDNGSEDTDDDDNVYPAVVKSDNILPPEWESDSESETELLDDDLLRRLDEHKRKTKELNEEARTAREQAWNERHKEAMIATYGTQEGRRFAQSLSFSRYTPCAYVANALQRGRGDALRLGRLGAHSPEHLHLDRPGALALSTKGQTVLRRPLMPRRRCSQELLEAQDPRLEALSFRQEED
jgi:hypothetical protein